MTCPRCGKEEHEAGRETDACVAELVMGWKRGPIFFDGVESEVLHHPTSFREYNQFPHYSTSIADAWQVVEKIAPATIEDTGEIWQVYRSNIDNDNGYWGEASTPELAICRAALEAI